MWMRKLVAVLFVMSLLFAPAAFASDYGIESPTVNEMNEPKVEGGVVVSVEELVLDQEQTEQFMALLGDLGFKGTEVFVGGTVEILLDEPGGTAVITVEYPTGAEKFLFAYDVEDGWVQVVNGDAAAAPETFAVADSGAYDQLPGDDMMVRVSYVASAKDAAPQPGGSSGGCAVGSVGGFSAMLLLLVPAVLLASKK
jgi:hypothetical protein